MSVDIKLKTILSATALSALSALPAYAEETKALDTIVVTGELQQRNLQDSQTSAVVLSGDELDTSTDGNFYDIIQRTPGVSSRFGEKGFVIRGIDATGTGGGDGIEGTTINVSVDGAEVPSGLGSFYGPYSSWDVQQVEVLRGPQSTQKGRNALAGAVHIKTNDPEFERETKVRADYGSRNTARIAFAHNEPINDKYALRISADHSQTDGWVDNPTRNEDDFDGREFSNGRLKFRANPNDQLDIIISHSVTDNQAGEDFVLADRFPSERVNLSDLESEEGSKHYITSANIKYDLQNNWALESNTSFYQHDYVRNEDFDQSAFQGTVFNYETEDESASQELKLKFDNQDNIRAVAGVYLSQIKNRLSSDSRFEVIRPLNEDIKSALNVDLAALGATFFIESADRTKQDVENAAIFGEIEFDINEQLTLLAGLRYDYESRERLSSTSRTSNPTLDGLSTQIAGIFAPQVTPLPLGVNFSDLPAVQQQAIIQAVKTTPLDPTDPNSSIENRVNGTFGPFLINASNPAEDDYDAWLPKLGLVYNLSDDLSMGFTVQRGYRAGGVQTNLVNGVNTKFDPEYTTNYEYTLRSISEDGRTRFNSNVFYTDWKDMQVTSSLSSIPGDEITSNAGKAEVWGAEFLLEHQLNGSVDLYTSAAYSETKYKEFFARGIDVSGNHFKSAPEGSMTTGTNFYVTDNWVGSFELAYTGSMFDDDLNSASLKIKSRTIANAKFGYETNRWAAYIYSRNLFDKDYINSTNRVLPADRTAVNPFLVRTGEPRFVGVQFNANF